MPQLVSQVALFMGAASFLALTVTWLRKKRQESTYDVNILGDTFCDLITTTETLPKWGEDTLADSIELMAGGSGLNTGTHLSRLIGSKRSCRLFAAIGPDMLGGLIRRHCELCAGLDLVNATTPSMSETTSDLLETKGTGACLVLTGSKDRAFVTDSGRNAVLGVDHFRETELLAASHLHIAGFYNCPRLWGPELPALLRKARVQGLSTSLCPQFDASMVWGNLMPVLPLVDVMFVNEDEARYISGREPVLLSAQEQKDDGLSAGVELLAYRMLESEASNQSQSRIEETSQRISDIDTGVIDAANDDRNAVANLTHTWKAVAAWFIEAGVRMVVITLGPQGALVMTSPGREVTVQRVPQRVSVVDTTGAGDAFNAGFLDGFRRKGGVEGGKAAVEEGLRWGIAAGTCCVTMAGASPLMRREDIAKYAVTKIRAECARQ